MSSTRLSVEQREALALTESLTGSPEESARFGLRVARWRGTRFDPEFLASSVYSQRLDLVILRLPSTQAHLAHRLSEHGLHPQYADTLVYYQSWLPGSCVAAPRNPDISFRLATAADAADLEVLVRACFLDYRSHYHANPHLTASSILEGYVEWAVRHIQAGTSDRQTWIARDRGKALAFACCHEPGDGNDGEIILNGVHPEHAGCGIYGDLIRFVRKLYAARGRSWMRISTQITNLAVQKVWQREGFHLQQSWVTFHLNPRLTVAETLMEFPTILGAGRAEPAGCAPEGPDAPRGAPAIPAPHGHPIGAAVVHSLLFELLQTNLPNTGADVMRLEWTRLALLVPGRKYVCRLRRTDAMAEAGKFVVIATLENDDGEMCLMASCLFGSISRAT